MFECRKTGLLWTVVLDEIDLLARQVASLCAVSCKVGIKFLQPLLATPSNPAARLFHVELTATLPNNDTRWAETLTAGKGAVGDGPTLLVSPLRLRM